MSDLVTQNRPTVEQDGTAMQVAKSKVSDKAKQLVLNFFARDDLAVPRGVNKDRLQRNALSVIVGSDAIAKCTPLSICECLTHASVHGWEIGGPIAHCSIVPYGGKATLVVGVRGLIDMVHRAGRAVPQMPVVVFEGDEFEDERGTSAYLRHREIAGDRRDEKATHVYWLCHVGSVPVFDVWTRQRIDAHKEKFSKAWQNAEGGKRDSPWHTHWSAMAMKTVVKYVLMRGVIPMSTEDQNLVHKQDEEEKGIVEGEVVR